MKNKKITLVLCMFILFLSLNILSATATDEDASNNIQKTETHALLAYQNSIKQEKDSNIYVESKYTNGDGSKNSPYNTINEENIGKMSSDSTIHVSGGNYSINSTIIKKNLSIIGENKDNVIFTPNESTSAFTIEKGVTLVLKNFTLRDFQSDTSPSITNNGKLVIENLNMLNNVASKNGGSIINNGDLTVINTIFKENVASFGAAIYNKANMTIINSTFDDNSIYNVGGAIYSIRGNSSVHNSSFTNNRAVSGAAIYNAFGYLYVNNTVFIENDAEHFFGGAIYSTGTTITNNSLFDSNHANKDGGAITTTSDFTIINCSFVENYANENGGVIENVPWSESENGKLTIINSSFTENTATYGGVIISYAKADAVGEPGYVSVRGSTFDSNTADIGGVIYNEQYIDFEDNAFVNNQAKKGNVIYNLNSTFIKSVDNNWWGTNNPSINDTGVVVKKWIVMNYTNTTALNINQSSKLKVSLNTLNNGKKISSALTRNVSFFADKSTFASNYMTVKGSVNNTVLASDDTISAQIDNQVLSLKAIDSRKAIKITVNSIKKSKYKENIIIKGKFSDIDGKILINSLLNVNVNGKNFNVKTDRNGIYSLKYKTNLTGINNLSVSYHGNSRYYANTSKSSFKVVKRGVILVLDSIDNLKYKENVTISAKFYDDANRPLYNTNLRLKINKKTLTVNTGRNASFKYTFRATLIGKNNITLSFGGNANYLANSTDKTFKVSKQDLIVTVNSIKDTTQSNKIKITGKLTDKNKHALMNSNIKIRLNNRSVIVKTDSKGVYNYVTLAEKEGVNTLVVGHEGNSYYNSYSRKLTFNVTKRKT